MGRKTELEKAIQKMDNSKITRELLKMNGDFINFNMNVPHASQVHDKIGKKCPHFFRSIPDSLLMSYSVLL